MQDKRNAKNRLFGLFAHLVSALANPHRLELLDLLAQAPRTVEDLAHEAGMSVANTSQHLQRLKASMLVTSEREGLYIRYRLASPAVARLWLELRRVAEQQLAEVEQALDAYRDRRHEFESIAVDEWQERQRNGEAILLDVRPAAEYEAGHLPGAISIPLDQLEWRLNELPANRQIIAYCRGPFCVLADQAVALLAERGWAVARLDEGILEWQSAGHALD